MKFTENAVNILVVKTYKGIGRAWVVKYLKGNESVDEIISLLNNCSKQESTITIDAFELKKAQIIDRLESMEQFCDGIVVIGDAKFPRYRGSVKEGERPIFLFYKGNIDLLSISNPNITVIGLLNPDAKIEAREQKIVAEIVKRGVTVVSGLAFGCDSIAHRQALIGGKTVAVLPSPLNKILPTKNKELAYQIVDGGGLLVTEYYEDFKSGMELSSRYKERDRLQALFCDTIILAASYAQDSAVRWNMSDQKLDSGARLAMGYAKEYNIPRAIMYDGSIDGENPMFDLNRQLMNEQKDIIILTQKKLEEVIDRIKTKKSDNDSNYIGQTILFN
jgi:DNA processing protein